MGAFVAYGQLMEQNIMSISALQLRSVPVRLLTTFWKKKHSSLCCDAVVSVLFNERGPVSR